jgi:hypothetical protein
MSDVIIQNGASNASGFPDAADDFALEPVKIESLADLLSYLNSKPTSQTPMLRTTAGKIAAFLGRSIDAIPLDLVHANREGFRSFLEGQRHKEGAVRSYINYLRMLMETAESLGWRPFAKLRIEWQSVLEQARKNHCLPLIKLLAQSKETPEQVSQADVDRLIEMRVTQGRCAYVTIRESTSAIWRTLVACGYRKNIPATYLRTKNYGVPTSKLPSPLKEEVAELVRWKSSEYEPDRPQSARVRPVSANGVGSAIGAMFGHATKIDGFGDINSIRQLFQRPVVSRYISWSINAQKVQGGPFSTLLASVLAALSKHPAHQSLDLSWFRPLLQTIPVGEYEEVKERKAKKYLAYDVLESIPGKMYAKRILAESHGENVDRLVMEELMITWELVLPWRQRNLRECRVQGENPNLFKSKVPEFSYVDKPEWVRQVEAENPNAEFWQFKFSPKETKTGVAVHSLVPRQLVGLLEEYLSKHRPLLLKGKTCNTLLVGPDGDVISKTLVTDIIAGITLRYGGRRVTPHLFRDIVAFAWLKTHPADYLTLSKMLWHKDIATTIRIYGSRFNESSATVAMESWIEERKKRSK